VQEVLPSQEEVVRRTEAITRCIQELLISAKDEKVRRGNYVKTGDNVLAGKLKEKNMKIFFFLHPKCHFFYFF
jgi:hypothetical protein